MSSAYTSAYTKKRSLDWATCVEHADSQSLPTPCQDDALASVIELLGGHNHKGRAPAKGSSAAVVIVRPSADAADGAKLSHLDWTTPELLVVSAGLSIGGGSLAGCSLGWLACHVGEYATRAENRPGGEYCFPPSGSGGLAATAA